jgi:hypothetical protein
LNGREHLGDLGMDERMILKWILEESSEEMWTGLNCLETESSAGFYDHDGHIRFRITEVLWPAD